MADPINSTNSTETQYVVPPDTDAAKLQAGLATSMRDLGILITFGTAILGFAQKHDIAGLTAYLQSEVALPAIALVAGIGLAAYRFIKARRSVKVTALAASTPAGTVVTVKDQ